LSASSFEVVRRSSHRYNRSVSFHGFEENDTAVFAYVLATSITGANADENGRIDVMGAVMGAMICHLLPGA
jgi:hypothetical protein